MTRTRFHAHLAPVLASSTFFAAAAVMAGLAGMGCSPAPVSAGAATPAAAAAPAPARVVVAVDRSESTAPWRGQQLALLDTVAMDASLDHRSLDLWAFDRTAVRVWGPNIPDTPKNLLPVKQKEFAPNAASPRRITRPALLLQALAGDPETGRASGPLRVLLLSDGDSEQAEDEPLLKKSAAALAAKHPDLQLLVIGVNPASRAMWDRAVAPVLGERFKAVTVGEADAELRRFHNR